jgi:hypothetical protein
MNAKSGKPSPRSIPDEIRSDDRKFVESCLAATSQTVCSLRMSGGIHEQGVGQNHCLKRYAEDEAQWDEARIQVGARDRRPERICSSEKRGNWNKELRQQASALHTMRVKLPTSELERKDGVGNSRCAAFGRCAPTVAQRCPETRRATFSNGRRMKLEGLSPSRRNGCRHLGELDKLLTEALERKWRRSSKDTEGQIRGSKELTLRTLEENLGASLGGRRRLQRRASESEAANS